MDHTRDNPLKRFSAFWIALLLVTAFGIACFILRPLTHGKVDAAYEMTGEDRLTIKADIDKVQADTLNVGALNRALEAKTKDLIKEPSAGNMPVPEAAPAPADKPADKPAETPAE